MPDQLPLPRYRKLVTHGLMADISVRQADVLLYRGTGFTSRIIEKAGRGKYSHAAMVIELYGELMVAETRQFVGGRIVTLASQVEKYPGLIDLYKIVPATPASFDRQAACEAMARFAGHEYGWPALWRTALSHAPFTRWIIQPSLDDSEVSLGMPYCSAAVSRAMRAGGHDPVMNLADDWTEPNDLMRSSVLRYDCTLLPNP